MRSVHLSEDTIQKTVMQHFALNGCKGVLMYHVPNGGDRHPAVASNLKVMGVLAGVADLAIVFAGARCAFVEIKATGGKMSDAQRRFQTWCENNAVPYYVTYGLEATLAKLRELGVLKAERGAP